MVRLKGSPYFPKKRLVIEISIPYGAIKRAAFFEVPFFPFTISIPYGAIKRKYYLP